MFTYRYESSAKLRATDGGKRRPGGHRPRNSAKVGILGFVLFVNHKCDTQ